MGNGKTLVENNLLLSSVTGVGGKEAAFSSLLLDSRFCIDIGEGRKISFGEGKVGFVSKGLLYSYLHSINCGSGKGDGDLP